MNKTESKFNFKTLLTFLTVLVLALSMVLATACTTDESTSESSSESTSESTSETKVDTQTLKNGDFEFTTGKNTNKPNTASSWSIKADGYEDGYSTSTSSSYVLIDTATDAYNALGSDYKNVKGEGETQTVENPGTPVTEDDADTEADESGTKVMMLRNKDFSAQYATSSTTLSVPAGEYGRLSVWVRTDDVESVLGSEAGAYVKVKHNVVEKDNATYDPLVIRNIDTKGEWVEYVIYLTPNQNRATTYTLVLGFGEGNKYNVEHHAKGWAYFDNAKFELVNEIPATTDYSAGVNKDFGVNLADADYSAKKEVSVNFSLIESDAVAFDVTNSSAIADGWNEVNPNGEVKKDDSKISVNANEVVIDFSDFAIGSSYTHTSAVKSLSAKSYVRISFWAKITAPSYATKATMAIYDVAKGKTVASFDNVSTDDYENELTDGFARYTFYLANNFETALDYQLKLSFGPTEKSAGLDVKTLPIGKAIFKDFEIETLANKDAYTLADVTTDTRAKKASLIGENYRDFVEDEDEDETSENDTYTVTVTGPAKTRLENGEMITVDELSSANLATSATSDKALIGVVNSKYYTADSDIVAALNAIKNSNAFTFGTNKEVQALAIKNITGNNYVAGNYIDIPKNSTYVFSIKVYAHSGSTAFVRLVDMEKSSSTETVVLLDGKLQTTVTNADSVKFLNGTTPYVNVTFIITTGAETFSTRLEFGTDGVAIFDGFNCGSVNSVYTSADVVKSTFFDGEDYVFSTEKVVPEIYYYADEADVGDPDLRLLDDDGNVRVEYGEETEIVALGRLSDDASVSAMIHYYRLDTDDNYVIEVDEDEEESVEESTSESTAELGENVGWLQVTSIIIALVLVGALIAIVVRKSMEGKTSKKQQTEKYYQGYNKNNRYSKKSDVAVPDEDDMAEDYDYGDDAE